MTANDEWIEKENSKHTIIFQSNALNEQLFTIELPRTLIAQIGRQAVEQYKRLTKIKNYDCDKKGHDFCLITATHYVCNICGTKRKLSGELLSLGQTAEEKKE
jgi:hypothetical protein